MDINFREYQRQVREGLFLNHGHDRISHIALGLAGEAGEVADIVKKSQYRGGKLNVDHLREELGDVLWYLTAMADETYQGLDEIAYRNIQKLEERHGTDHYSSQLLVLVPR